MSEPAPQKTKYVLECVGLLVTILGGIGGLAVAYRSNTPAEAPATQAAATPQPTATPDTPPVRLASSSLSARGALADVPAPQVASVDVAQIRDAAELQTIAAQNTAKLDGLLDSYLEQVVIAEPRVIGYNADRQGCIVDIALTTDMRRYVGFLSALEPLLELDSQLVDRLAPGGPARLPSAPLTVAVHQERNGPRFEFAETATTDAANILSDLADRKPPRGSDLFPKAVLTVAPTSSGKAGDGQQLDTRVWRVTRATGKAFFEKFTAAADAKLRIELADAAGGSIATQTLPTSTPHAGTWNQARFVLPAALLGNRSALGRGRFEPMASQRSAHQSYNDGRQLLGLLPGFCSAPQRVDGEKKTATPEFIPNVTYQLVVPMTAEAAVQVASATATLVR